MKGPFMSNSCHLRGEFEAALTQSPIQRLCSVESQQEVCKPDWLSNNKKEQVLEQQKALQWPRTHLP